MGSSVGTEWHHSEFVFWNIIFVSSCYCAVVLLNCFLQLFCYMESFFLFELLSNILDDYKTGSKYLLFKCAEQMTLCCT